LPLGLRDEFARDQPKRAQWSAYLDKNRLKAPNLDEVIELIRHLIAESLVIAHGKMSALTQGGGADSL